MLEEGTCAVCKAWLAESGQPDIVKQAKAEERQRIIRIVHEIHDEFLRRPPSNRSEMRDAFAALFERLDKA